MTIPNYSLEVFEDYAIIRGHLTTEMLTLLIKLCAKEGFKYLTNIGDGTPGFKLIK